MALISHCCQARQVEDYLDVCANCGERTKFIHEECIYCPVESDGFCQDFEKECETVTQEECDKLNF